GQSALQALYAFLSLLYPIGWKILLRRYLHFGGWIFLRNISTRTNSYFLAIHLVRIDMHIFNVQKTNFWLLPRKIILKHAIGHLLKIESVVFVSWRTNLMHRHEHLSTDWSLGTSLINICIFYYHYYLLEDVGNWKGKMMIFLSAHVGQKMMINWGIDIALFRIDAAS
ncbi:hypothetical protein ACJX0J_016023, partial [Zea mays]